MKTRQTVATFLALALLTSVAPSLTWADTPTQTPEQTFQAAQRGIWQAIFQLETYLRQSPNGKNATTAKLQLEDLHQISLFTSSKKYYGFDGPNTLWRITNVDRQDTVTHVTIEIKDVSDDTKHYTQAFDKVPLVLIDNHGQYYPSGDVSDMPLGVEATKNGQGNDNQWVFSVGMTFSVTVDFPPLAPDAASGKVFYKDVVRT